LVLVTFAKSDFNKCAANLIHLDHSLNCPGIIQEEKIKGVIDEHGNWDITKTNDWLVTFLLKSPTTCPISGNKYRFEYVVGSHPVCLTHGNLVSFFGYVPHKTTKRGVIWICGILTLVLSTILFSIISLIRIISQYTRIIKERHKLGVKQEGSQPGV